MRKGERQKRIRTHIAAERITSQNRLVQALRSEGFPVTQASISRDFDELGIIKANGRYVLPEMTQRAGRFGRVSFEPAGENLIVAKCQPGLASAVAVRIDARSFPEICGTIAGDDTIFIAVSGAIEQRHALRALRELFDREG